MQVLPLTGSHDRLLFDCGGGELNTWLAQVASQRLPEAWRKKMPRRVPGVRLGRLAVDLHCRRQGLGELLLVDAMTRAHRIYAEAGGMGLFVDALDDQAATFYQRYGFVAAPDQPLLLFLPVQTASPR